MRTTLRYFHTSTTPSLRQKFLRFAKPTHIKSLNAMNSERCTISKGQLRNVAKLVKHELPAEPADLVKYVTLLRAAVRALVSTAGAGVDGNQN